MTLPNKVPNSLPTAPISDRFMQTLRQTLEHVDDHEWLEKRSPLASVLFAGASPNPARKRQVVLTGLPAIDERLRTIWHDWEARPKTALQSLLWESVCHLPPDLESHSQAILFLTYFADPRPKQNEVVKLLALGRSTYYRYLERAVETLGGIVVQSLRPALQLEQITAAPLIGRAEMIAQAQIGLDEGHVVHLVGGGGLGKTSLGAHLAAHWRKGAVFWYTFRPSLTDHLDQLLFTLAYFFHQQGASALWLHLNANPQENNLLSALAILRQHFLDLRAAPPLLCFDEVDLLLANDLRDSQEHERLRAFLDALAQAVRAGAPLLLIGQKVLLEPQADCLITLAPLTAPDLTLFLKSARVALDAAGQERLLRVTRGNPLLLRLFLALHQRGATLADTLKALTAPVALDWVMARLRQHLAPDELTLLQELAVFQSSAPRDAWRKSQKALTALVTLGLVESVGNDGVTLHPTFRDLIYQGLPPARKSELELAAAHLLADRGRFTAAARHYILGGRPEMAIWTWLIHRQEEIDQGQSTTALELFAPLAHSTLPTFEDQQALTLLLAPLYARAGRSQEGLQLMEKNTWPTAAPRTVHAHALRGELLAETGNIDRALAEYRRSLDSITKLRATQEIDLRLEMGRKALVYLGDNEQARQEALQARLLLDVLQGEIEDNAGNYGAARSHYQNALAAAESCANDHHLAKIYEALGILEARYAELEPAVAYLQAAGRHHEAAGNLVCAVGMTNSSLAFVYLLRRRYAEAIAPAETALAFFRQLNHAYWLAINEAYLAEAWFYQGDLAKAEGFAQAGLQREEVVVRPYCLTMLGHIRRAQQRFGEAERYGQEAVAAGEERQDLWALGPAWLAMGETYRDVGRDAEARQAFQQGLRIYEQLGIAQEVTFAQALLASVVGA
jgi:tetratricopeptide (TPR) repeat protein